MIPLDVFVEMYLAPEATGVHDWTSVTRSTSPAYSVRRESGIEIIRGNDNLNEEPTPGTCSFAFNDPSGTFNDRNPMGIYHKSIKRGVQTRLGILRVDDQFGRTETNTWGSVGNTAGDVWTNGTSTGGTVAATDWTVSSGSARHSLPADSAYRVSELSKTERIFIDSEIRLRIKVPTSNVTGTGALASEVWFRCVDVSNFIGVSVVFEVDETIKIAFYDRTAAFNRYLMAYTTISGLTLGGTGVDYDLRCQIEGESLRAKLWEVGEPEPMDWSVYASGATIREGYTSVASYAFAGNTNTKPLVFQYDQLQARLIAFTGEITNITPTGDGKTAPKITSIRVADILDRLQTPGASTTQSVMRRGRTSTRRWLLEATKTVTGFGTTRVLIITTSTLGNIGVGDFLFLFDYQGRKKEDTQFTIVSTLVSGSDTHLTLSPDARDAIIAGDIFSAYHLAGPGTTPIAYWPCEDGQNATQISSGLVNGVPMAITGSPTFATESGIPSSAPLLQLNNSVLTGPIADYVDTYQTFTITFVIAMPTTDEAATGSDLIQFLTTGNGYSCDLRYTATGGGSLKLRVHDSALTLLFDSGDIDFSLRGAKCEIGLVMRQSGGTVTYRIYRRSLVGGTLGIGPSTVTGVTTLGKITQIKANSLAGYDSVAMGHITVIPDAWEVNGTFPDFTGWSNQAALHRLYRLCYEESIPLYYRTDRNVLSSNLGPQKVMKLTELLAQAQQSDGGFLYGPRGAIALEHCSRGSLSNLPATATISMADGHIVPPFDPTGDYSSVRNRVTVNRIDGTSATADMTDGPLSSASPPEGIGLRDQAFTLSLGSDVQTINHANYRLGLGTVNQYRVPGFTITPAAADSISVERLMSIDIGRRVDITDLSTKDIYDDLPQLVLGYTLNIGDRFYPRLSMNCAPYEPFRIFALTDDEYAVPDATDTVTGSTLTTTQTGSLTLTSTSGGHLWTTLASDFPRDIMISGERITISGITGETSPQTATITARSVNGVVKAHGTNEEVTLVIPNYWAFR